MPYLLIFSCILPPPLLSSVHVHPAHQDAQCEGGKVYYSYRLVRSERSGERVRQRTLLNLGSEFAVATEHWAVLCSRIEQLLERQGVLVELDCPEEVERKAQRIAMQLVQRGPEVGAGGTDLQTVDVESLELARPRTVGVEQVDARRRWRAFWV